MSEIDLESKFPDMRPVSRPPSLQTINGIGTVIVGSRDFDEETGTYVKTRCFAILFIPLVALGAYRVFSAPTGGWYFLGRVPLSGFAKLWNVLLVFILIGIGGAIGWHKYSHTPEFLAARKLEEGDDLAASGNIAAAAQEYRAVAFGDSGHGAEAAERVKGLLANAGQAPLSDVAAVCRTSVEINRRHAVPNLFDKSLDIVERNADKDPKGALEVLEAVAPIARDEKILGATRQRLLEPLVAKEPNNPEYASQLALVYETQRQQAKCEKLLTPLKDKLGDNEGARILGQIYAREGKFDQAAALLLPYTEAKLKRLHETEKTLGVAYERAQEQLIQRIQKEEARDFPYDKYKSAPQDRKNAIAGEYLNGKLKDDPTILAAQDALARETNVVPVALDLGFVLLQRGQSQPDPAARRKMLEKAEQTFLSVSRYAERSNEYRLSLAQVDYWLGKHAEGRKLFDEVLESGKRNTDTLVGVSGLLREVGAVSEARPLAEEAFNKETDKAKKNHAAMLRAVMFSDIDDEITWLRRADQGESTVRAELASALGHKAMQEGRDDEAAHHFRESIQIYDKQPETASSLNNTAMTYLSLFNLTGDSTALNRGVERIDKALTLLPGNSVLLANAARSLLGGAVRDVIGSSLDLKLLKSSGDLNTLPYLYQDQAGKEPYRQKVLKSPGIQRTVQYLERLMLLAPKNPESYTSLLTIYRFTGDRESLRGLARRLQSVELDHADHMREAQDYYTGKKDDQFRKTSQARVDREAGLLQAARQGSKGATVAVAACTLAQAKETLELLGMAIDHDELVTLAEEAHKAAPSSATRSALTSALLARANQILTKQEPAYAAMAKRALRSLGQQMLVAVALQQPAGLGAKVAANRDVRRAADLIKESSLKFPEDADPWWWAVLRTAHPDDAARMAKLLPNDEVGQLERAIEGKLSPFSAATAFRLSWAKELAGKPEEGKKILKDCASQGVPMPFDVK